MVVRDLNDVFFPSSKLFLTQGSFSDDHSDFRNVAVILLHDGELLKSNRVSDQIYIKV